MTTTNNEANNEAADLLDDAADLIEVNGWTRGRMEDDEGRYCARGALTTASRRRSGEWRGLATYQTAIDGLRDIILEQGQTLAFDGSIVLWNDAGARTEQEVLDTLRKAAKELRS